MEIKLTDQQRLFLGNTWPLRDQYTQINNLTIIAEPVTKIGYITLLWPKTEEHGLILLINQKITEFLKNLQREHYCVYAAGSWQEAIRYLFVYFRGVFPKKISEKIFPESDHWRVRLDCYLQDIRSARADLIAKMDKKPPESKHFNVDQYIQYELRRYTHPAAILAVLNQISKIWDRIPIVNPWGYAQKISKIESQNFNAEDATKLHQQIKQAEINFFSKANFEK